MENPWRATRNAGQGAGRKGRAASRDQQRYVEGQQAAVGDPADRHVHRHRFYLAAHCQWRAEWDYQMIHYDLYRERHKQMIDYQAQIAPFTPTLEELTKVWNVEKTAAAWSLKH